MDVSQNVRLTLACRVLLIRGIRSGRPQAKVAREMGISTKTVAEWLRWFQ